MKIEEFKNRILRLAIVGSRTFTDFNRLQKEVLKLFYSDDINCIISGGAKGADKLAEKFAKLYNKPMIIFKPFNYYVKNINYCGVLVPIYDVLDNKLYYTRNKQIVDNCDFLIAFWNGKSGGTKMTINYAKQQNKKYKIIKV
jgi:hypothetical protein